MRVYAASSWRNTFYDDLLNVLRGAGHEVWNWREPPTGGNGFKWQDTVPAVAGYQHGMLVEISLWREMLSHPIAQAGFASDLAGMNWCEVGVLLHPCGRSAHLEAGWIAGRGKKVHVLALEPVEPDLMVLALNGKICGNTAALIQALHP
ncbi:MAG TPA: hypothetical protein VFO41_04125 [Alphaproteobacteria bacterium]|nr:hypothetical protein [Alphaproteobacteria bacterium]